MASTTRVRMWRWRANPLRRRSDRMEAWVLLTAFVLAVLGSVAAAVLTWGAAYGSAEQQRAARHKVTAVTTQNADDRGRQTFYQAPGADSTRVPVRWTAPDGTVQRGAAQVPDGSKAGTEVAIWVGPDGRQTAPPAGPAMAALQAGICAVLAGGTVTALVCAAQAGVRRRIDARRADQWERDWARVEPQWRHRTP